jgi:hypothetical protein
MKDKEAFTFDRKNLQNRVIFGISGSGKSVLVKDEIAQLSEKEPVIIIGNNPLYESLVKNRNGTVLTVTKEMVLNGRIPIEERKATYVNLQEVLRVTMLFQMSFNLALREVLKFVRKEPFSYVYIEDQTGIVLTQNDPFFKLLLEFFELENCAVTFSTGAVQLFLESDYIKEFSGQTHILNILRLDDYSRKAVCRYFKSNYSTSVFLKVRKYCRLNLLQQTTFTGLYWHKDMENGALKPFYYNL